MKGQFNFVVNDPLFSENNFFSDWYDVSSYTKINYFSLCSVDAEQVVQFAFNKNYDIVHEEIKIILPNIPNEMTQNVKTKFMRFGIKNISSNPCKLVSQSFFIR